jgi:hypothetical protein
MATHAIARCEPIPSSRLLVRTGGSSNGNMLAAIVPLIGATAVG